MHAYAQTNIQLFNQLPIEIYTGAELRRIRAAYDLAACLVTGRFQASGKPLLAHLVGVASILTAHGVPSHLVAAGLIHSVYRNGDFGWGRPGISEAKRRVVRDAVGDEVEQYAARFATLPWKLSTLSELQLRLPVVDALDRDVVLMRLADHLEHQLDRETFYHGHIARRAFMKAEHDRLVQMAVQLGYPLLAEELQRAHAPAPDVPLELRGSTSAQLFAPRSHRRRLALRVQDRLADHVARWRSGLARSRRVVTVLRARRSGAGAPSA